jgi:hypothetical protein
MMIGTPRRLLVSDETPKVPGRTVDQLADSLTLRAGFNEITERDPLHTWELSGVERLNVYDEHGDRTVILKHATAPLTGEASTLQW